MNTQIKEPMLSYCVPVYNAREDIRSCIDSMYRQGFTDFEIVCVDDCSTDGSDQILKELASQHPEIRLLHNDQNRGISYTRSRTLKESRGKYVWFVDADDLLVPDCAGRFVETAEEEAALAVLGSFVTFRDGEAPSVREGSMQTRTVRFSDPDSFYPKASPERPCFGIWLGIFNRAFLIQNQIFFREELNLFEDMTFYLEFGMKAKEAVRLDCCGYCYRLKKNSASHDNRSRLMKKGFENSLKALDVYAQYTDKCDPELTESLRLHTLRMRRIAAQDLVKIEDREYVKRGLKVLREKGLYPYVYEPAIEYSETVGKKRILINRMIANPLTFWIMRRIFLSILK